MRKERKEKGKRTNVTKECRKKERKKERKGRQQVAISPTLWSVSIEGMKDDRME